MNILALETSASVASAAVLKDGSIITEQILNLGLTHSEIILPLAERVLSDAKLMLSDIDCFAVNAGPGSFTGIRIGVCAINAMAAALGKKVIAIDALTILTANATEFDGIVSPILDARSDRIYAAAFCCNKGLPALQGEITACTMSEWIDILKERYKQNILFLGDGALAHRELLQETFGNRAAFAMSHQNLLRASCCAVLANARAQKGEWEDEAMPIYLRTSQAERMKSDG